MARVRIRWGVVDDAAQVTEIHVQGWKIGYRGMLPQEALDGIEASQRLPRWTRTLEGAAWPRRGTLVVEDDDGRLVGFADLRPTADSDGDPDVVGEIASLYVHPDVWRHGVGAQLMAESVQRLRAAGFAAATLWVHDANERAIRFYEHAGWTPDGATNLDTVRGQQIMEARYRRALA